MGFLTQIATLNHLSDYLITNNLLIKISKSDTNIKKRYQKKISTNRIVIKFDQNQHAT
jgi:hypothetical protein